MISICMNQILVGGPSINMTLCRASGSADLVTLSLFISILFPFSPHLEF